MVSNCTKLACLGLTDGCKAAPRLGRVHGGWSSSRCVGSDENVCRRCARQNQ